MLHEQNKTGGAITQKIYPGVEVHTLNPSIETDRRISLESEGQPDLHGEFQASQSYVVSETLSQKKEGEK